MRVAAVLSVVVSTSVAACGDPTCEFDNPCPERFDLGTWCATSMKCTVDGVTLGNPGMNLALRRGQVLSIPIGEVMQSVPALDILLVTFAGSGCAADGAFPMPLDMSVALDNVPGAPWTYTYAGDTLHPFRWIPPPAAPVSLEIRYDDPYLYECLSLWVYAVDAECEASNPQPICGL